ncbi:MAG TPA: enoyl-CoA hydratase/isomerase family protein [Acidimicrobiia bacterium]|nr:enoyl-CoA hydratase/isomerase family protein [Acidimicrobiia bacterium]
MSYDALQCTRVDLAAGVAWATIDHPPMNLWDTVLTHDLVTLISAFETDPEARVLVLTSADPEYFIAHADVEMIRDLPTDALGAEDGPAPINQLFERFRIMPKVSIALIRGIARGGGSEIALACDLRFATPEARLAQPEVALGIIPGAGGTQRLTRLVGRARALEIVLGCGDVTGTEAASIGYVNRVVDAAVIDDDVRALAGRIATMPSHAVEEAKRAIDAALPDPIPGLALEGQAFQTTLGHAETRRRMDAFLAGGGQTRDGERDLAAVLDRLGEA